MEVSTDRTGSAKWGKAPQDQQGVGTFIRATTGDQRKKHKSRTTRKNERKQPNSGNTREGIK
jgi:hypothetical protein